MVPPPRVLYVGHDASRTGAPTVGRSFVRWLAASGQADVQVLLLGPGPLVADFEAMAPTTVRGGGVDRALAGAAIAGRSLRRGDRTGGDRTGGDHGLVGLRARAGAVRRPGGGGSWGRHPPHLVLANSLGALEAATRVRRSGPLVCWVHELDHVADVQHSGRRHHRSILPCRDRPTVGRIAPRRFPGGTPPVPRGLPGGSPAVPSA